MNKKILLLLLLVIYLKAGFIRHDTNKTVIDTKTALIWSDTENDIILRTWKDSVKICEDLEISFYKNWRLPNYNELYSLIDLKKANSKIDDVFQNKTPNRYWTSTISSIYLSTNPTSSVLWTISFASGTDKFISINNSNTSYSRCVHNQ